MYASVLLILVSDRMKLPIENCKVQRKASSSILPRRAASGA